MKLEKISKILFAIAFLFFIASLKDNHTDLAVTILTGIIISVCGSVALIIDFYLMYKNYKEKQSNN